MILLYLPLDLGTRLVNGREMRRGYTTGSCAAAAAKAAVYLLINGAALETVEIDTPAGLRLKLPVLNPLLSGTEAECSIKKDAGDDPDITDGIIITAKACPISQGIVLKGGKGVGEVTRPGLPVSVGQPAINPGPRRMIESEVRSILPEGTGVEITFSIPGGEELAKKTFNPRLGIMGGLSILGTTGIVEPMSEEAWKESLKLELSVISGEGRDEVILVPGNYGENFVRNSLRLNKTIVKMSNFVGYALQSAVALGFKKILLVGDIGKLIKVSAGIFNTHSREADARMELMAAYAGVLGANRIVLEQILELNTTAAAMDLLEKEGISGLYPLVAGRVSQRAGDLIHGAALVGTVLFSNSRGLLCIDQTGKELMEMFINE